MKTIIVFGALLSVVLSETHFLSKEFIENINSKQKTWTAGHNYPSDTPLLHFKKLASLKGVSADPNFTLPTLTRYTPIKLPTSFDARTAWPKCESIRRIRDQGHCGSCWAFGAVETMSDRLCISARGAQQFTFSPEELISCCLDCGYGCEGGYLLQPFQYWQTIGIPSGGDEGSKLGCRPYTAGSTGVTPICSQHCVNTYGKQWKDDIRHGVSAYSISPSETAMKNEIVSNGPIEAAFTVYEDFFSYTGGVYQHTTGGEVGGHAIKIIGYGTENGVDYWLVSNSWGASWGDKGFFKIKRGVNECGIEESPTAGFPQI